MMEGAPVSDLSGIGPKKAAALRKAGIQTVADLLVHYPRSYQDQRRIVPIGDLRVGADALVRGHIEQMAVTGFGRRRTLRLLVADASGTIEILLFHAAYLAQTLSRESAYQFYGSVVERAGRRQMLHPEISRVSEETDAAPGWQPVYPLVRGITQKDLRNWMDQALPLTAQMEDHLPVETLKQYRLAGFADAIRTMHRPASQEAWRAARFRLVFDEFLLLLLGIRLNSRRRAGDTGAIRFPRDQAMQTFMERLPFAPTDAQQRVLREINADMTKPTVMDRLIQGDVGSGKTMVAAAAAYKAICGGHQAVLMAPTEILARQHIETFTGWLAPLGVRTEGLTGRLAQKQRSQLLARLEAGEIDMLIGTHALLQPEVRFHSLGLVITDEQHRFGVRQRRLLTEKGGVPDRLVMTATPIPKTLAATLYGELDVSVIDELPPGRKPVATRIARSEERRQVYRFLREQVGQGRQAYVVAPLIEESDKMEAKAATELYEGLTAFFPDLTAGLLHGDMSHAEKDRVMEAFVAGEISVLVSTLVVEVGVHVANATVMIIESADRFGLATLHQLRGRVGRGEEQSHCILISDSREGIAAERADIMRKTGDGFLIAEKDLALRGPGEFFGTRQHGLPELKLADPVRHARIMEQARILAQALLTSDPELSSADHQRLRQRVEGLFAGSTETTV